MFGFNATNFSDPFDVNKVAGTENRERAKLRSQAFLDDSEMGGNALGTYAKNKAENIMAKAGAAAQRTASNAAGISGIFNAVGSIGSFGAAGGFDPSKTFMNGSIFGSTPIGAGGGTLPKIGIFGKQTVGTLGPNYGIPQ